MKNRHISMQLIKAVAEIERQSAVGWYAIDIVSHSSNSDLTIVKSGIIELQFAKLNGDGISKWVFIARDGKQVNIGEYK